MRAAGSASPACARSRSAIGAQAFALDLRVIGLVEGEKACPVDPEEGRAAACFLQPIEVDQQREDLIGKAVHEGFQPRVHHLAGIKDESRRRAGHHWRPWW